MLTYPSIDPVVFAVGPLTVHWYGVMYLIGFLGGGALGVLRAEHLALLGRHSRSGISCFMWQWA